MDDKLKRKKHNAIHLTYNRCLTCNLKVMSNCMNIRLSLQPLFLSMENVCSCMHTLHTYNFLPCEMFGKAFFIQRTEYYILSP